MSAQYAKTVKLVAMAVGRKPSTISKWVQNDGCPCRAVDRSNRGYNLDKVRRWAITRGYAIDTETGHIVGDLRGRVRVGKNGTTSPPTNGGVQADGDQPNITMQLRAAQAAEREGKAQLVQLQLKEKKGELIAIEDVKEHDVKRHLFMKQTLEMWSRSLGPRLAGKTAIEITQAMQLLVEELMRTFSGSEE